jgi:hypothetical protein
MSRSSENLPARSNEPADPSVRLVASARFFTATAPLGRGIRARDLRPMANGLVEEHSPLPLEQTAWGFLAEPARKKDGVLLYFAAARTSVFPEVSPKARAAQPVFPAFAALHGLRMKTPTWVFLADDQGVAALLFQPGVAIPVRVLARFIEDEQGDEASRWRVRDELAAECRPDRPEEIKKEQVLEGLIRATGVAGRNNRGVVFTLERQTAPGGAWTFWKKTQLKKADQVLGADLRDHAELESTHRTHQSGQRILATAAIFGAAVLALVCLELLLFVRHQEALKIRQGIEARADAVERLQEIEQMNGVLNEVFTREFLPFDWLMLINDHRPEEITFGSYGIEAGADLAVQGQAREVGLINAFAERLGTDPRFRSVQLEDVQTTREGATFQLRIGPGDIRAQPPERGTLDSGDDSGTEGVEP